MTQLLQEIGKLSAGALGLLTALAGAVAAIVVATATGLASKFIVTPFLNARDKQDREVEWRKHAIELTKLDLERRLKTRAAREKTPIRPSILDFLANYRDLQELGQTTARDLYEKIRAQRISKPTSSNGNATKRWRKK